MSLRKLIFFSLLITLVASPLWITSFSEFSQALNADENERIQKMVNERLDTKFPGSGMYSRVNNESKHVDIYSFTGEVLGTIDMSDTNFNPYKSQIIWNEYNKTGHEP